MAVQHSDRIVPACVVVIAIAVLAARGASPAAFGLRCIPPGCVAPPSNIPDSLALPHGRITSLGATLDLHHGLLGAPLPAAQVPPELRARAEQGDAEAQNELGSRYYEGRGVPQNDAEAVRWVRLAAEQGYARGQYNLGLIYFRGRGVPEDEAEAVTWYRRAADQGYTPAQAALGYMYEYGAGVAQDQVLAYMWLYLAAARSPDEFWTRLYSQKRDEIAEMMTPEQLADARRLAAAWKPLAER